MKRQLNFWSKIRNVPDAKLINTCMSLEGNQLTISFRRPGSVQPIDQLTVTLSEEDLLQWRLAFELAGAVVFEDEMDERIYFANIATANELKSNADNLRITVFWSCLVYIVCMFIGLLMGLTIGFSSIISLIVAISFGIFIKKKYYKDQL